MLLMDRSLALLDAIDRRVDITLLLLLLAFNIRTYLVRKDFFLDACPPEQTLFSITGLVLLLWRRRIYHARGVDRIIRA